MNDYTRKNMRNRKRRIERRLGDRHWTDQAEPMFSASNIHYEMGERTRGTAVGGIGAMQLVARRTGLIEAIDQGVHVLKRHLPYHESDHVLNIAYNALSGGTCLEDIELRRNDEVYLDALGAQRIPDPTTAGDFCRRFEREDVEDLMDVSNEVRLGVWRQQPEAFFEEAVLDGDGTLSETTGKCKQGMDVAYNGVWGYHPLLISWPTQANRCTWSTAAGTGRRMKGRPSASTKPSICVVERVFARSCCEETPTSVRRGTWIDGTNRAWDSSLVSTR